VSIDIQVEKVVALRANIIGGIVAATIVVVADRALAIDQCIID
jgi:hypothetical protein